MTPTRRQFLTTSALAAGAIVLTPFGRAMAAPAAPESPSAPLTPAAAPTAVVATNVLGSYPALDNVLKSLPAYTTGEPLRTVKIKPGTYKRAKPIMVPSGVLLDAGGCTFVLQTKGKFDALLRIENVHDVTINGGRWDGNKKILKGKKYAKWEWRHAIRLHNSQNVTLQNLTATNAKGDGIYVGLDLHPCQNVTINNVRSTKNARSGLAITACDGLTATNSYFYSNSGKAPEAGVVIEPHDRSIIDHITFKNCKFYSNGSRGFLAVMKQSTSLAPATGIELNNCTLYSNGKSTKDVSTAGVTLMRPRKIKITGGSSYGNQFGVFILGRRTGDAPTVHGDVTLDHFTVTGNRKDGVIIENSIKSLVIQNASKITNNSRKKKYAYDGLRIKQGSNVKVSDSAITTKHRYGVCADKGVSGVVLTHTNLTGNKKGAFKGTGVTYVP